MTSVAELEREVEETRSRLYDTIDRIQDRMTVSGIVDEVLGAARIDRSGDAFGSLIDVFRRHPVPVLVAAAGIGWLIHRMSVTPARAVPAPLITDADFAEVPVITTGHDRTYDPDGSSLHGAGPSDVKHSATF